MSITVSAATEAEIIALKQGIDYVVYRNQGQGPENPVATAALSLQTTILNQYNTGGYTFTGEPMTDIVDQFG